MGNNWVPFWIELQKDSESVVWGEVRDYNMWVQKVERCYSIGISLMQLHTLKMSEVGPVRKLPSFGNHLEHTQHPTLAEWALEHDMNLNVVRDAKCA